MDAQPVPSSTFTKPQRPFSDRDITSTPMAVGAKLPMIAAWPEGCARMFNTSLDATSVTENFDGKSWAAAGRAAKTRKRIARINVLPPS